MKTKAKKGVITTLWDSREFFSHEVTFSPISDHSHSASSFWLLEEEGATDTLFANPVEIPRDQELPLSPSF
jgi:hypothetical protein